MFFSYHNGQIQKDFYCTVLKRDIRKQNVVRIQTGTNTKEY